jgi:hypothetical protein
MVLKDRRWHEQGNCNRHPDPDLWHYNNSNDSDVQKLEVLRSVQAIELCHICPVRVKCLEQGLERENLEFTGGHGSIWGGLLTVERYLLTTKKPQENMVRSERRHRKNVRLRIARIDK